MHEQRQEVDRSADHAVEPGLGPAQPIEIVGQDLRLCGDHEDEQGEDQEKGQVEPDRDAEHLADLDAVAAEESESHVFSICTQERRRAGYGSGWSKPASCRAPDRPARDGR